MKSFEQRLGDFWGVRRQASSRNGLKVIQFCRYATEQYQSVPLA